MGPQDVRTGSLKRRLSTAAQLFNIGTRRCEQRIVYLSDLPVAPRRGALESVCHLCNASQYPHRPRFLERFRPTLHGVERREAPRPGPGLACRGQAGSTASPHPRLRPRRPNVNLTRSSGAAVASIRSATVTQVPLGAKLPIVPGSGST
jgi:hypothetical protein